MRKSCNLVDTYNKNLYNFFFSVYGYNIEKISYKHTQYSHFLRIKNNTILNHKRIKIVSSINRDICTATRYIVLFLNQIKL